MIWLTNLATVDLPHPYSPTMPKVSPLLTSKDTLSTALTLSLFFKNGILLDISKCFFTSLTWSILFDTVFTPLVIL